MKVNVFYCNTYAEVQQTAVCSFNFTLKKSLCIYIKQKVLIVYIYIYLSKDRRPANDHCVNENYVFK